MRILFTSSDPGSAQQNNALAKALNKSGIFECAFISSLISSQYYTSKYPKYLCLDYNVESEKKKINDFIKSFKPDFIILGLSPSTKSIDYIALEIALDINIRTASIQDYYGWFGAFNKEIKPDYIFVLDKYAEALAINENIIEYEKIIITGSPKHYNYFDQTRYWNKELKKIKYANKELIFFLQPMDIVGIKSNFINICESIKTLYPDYKLNVKPHPLDLKSQTLNAILKKYSINLIDDKKPVELLLLFFDNIFTCFSTIAYDLYFINRHLVSFNKPKLFNLLIGEDIFTSIKKLKFNIRHTPQYRNGKNIEDRNMLDKNIKLIFNTKFQNTYTWKTNQSRLLENPSLKIMNIIKGN